MARLLAEFYDKSIIEGELWRIIFGVESFAVLQPRELKRSTTKI
jgi:hypothetical protein